MNDLPGRLAGALADRYRIERKLGEGGMATVYLAQDLRHSRQVALKVLRAELAATLGPERFLQEVRIAANLQHPHILPVHDSGEAGGFLFYVMPYVEGQSLRDRLVRDGELPIAEATRILRDVADALSAAHAKGIVHRDIKPENIMLSGRHALVADFGVAKAVSEATGRHALTTAGVALGTPSYMAPEQAAADPHVDHRADIYAFGVMAYEVLTGQPPFTGHTAQAIIAAHMTQAPVPVSERRATIPLALAQLVMRCLAKKPADRPQSTEQVLAVLEGLGTPSGGITPAETQPVRMAQPTAHRRWLVGAGLALLLAASALVWWRTGERATLAADLLVVAPFDVLSPGLELWREGLVDVLARNLDGAGDLRTVPPSAVIRGWSGRADAPSAVALGQRTGARLAVFGQLLATRADSVKLRATLYDVAAGRSLGEVEAHDLATNMDHVADSITVGLLRELGRTRPVGSVRSAALRATSLPALKAFLRAEQFFRRNVWDSALAAYQETVALDSGFALAWRGMAKVVGWTVIAGDSLSEVYALRAGALNRGLAPRESLLVAAESLAAAVFTAGADANWHAHRARLYQTLERASERYPQDPEVWYELGDAEFHFVRPGRSNPERTLELFDRAIALDSAFGESYIHAMWLGYQFGGAELGERYRQAYVRNVGETGERRSIQILGRLAADSGASAEQVDSLLRGATTRELTDAYLGAAHWNDGREAAILITRALRNPSWALSASLAYRGHLKTAYSSGGTEYARVHEMAALGGVPDSVARAEFQRWLDNPQFEEPPSPAPDGFNTALFNALPWWAQQRDTASLRTFALLMAASERAVPTDRRHWLAYGRHAAEGYLALARGDTAGAVARFASLPDTICSCLYDRIIKAQLLLGRGDAQAAMAAFDGQSLGWQDPAAGLWYLQRARAAEAVKQTERARADYQRVVDLWRHADPELQPYVTEAKVALSRLRPDR